MLEAPPSSWPPRLQRELEPFLHPLVPVSIALPQLLQLVSDKSYYRVRVSVKKNEMSKKEEKVDQGTPY